VSFCYGSHEGTEFNTTYNINAYLAEHQRYCELVRGISQGTSNNWIYHFFTG
jgi:hypothetical protein